MKKTKAEQKKKRESKKQQGITLIALVITIIVLLILAGVSIATLTGENGILTRAEEASKQTEIENVREKAELAKQGELSKDLGEGKETTREDIINAIVDEMGGIAEGNLITTEDGKYEIMVKEDNSIEVVEKGQGYIDAEYKEPAPESDFRWTTLEDGTVRIYEYLGTETSLNIPDTIDGKAVTVLRNDGRTGDSSGFIEGGRIAKNVELKSVKIPDTVTIIGGGAFYNGGKLEYIQFPKSLTTIEGYAFNGNQLKKVDIPDTVITIGYRAFYNNEIENLKLSSNITRIEDGTFSANKIRNIEIPEGVTYIGRKAFSNNQITKIEIPKRVTYIGASAFSNNQATEIEIPSTVTTIGSGAFTRNNIEKIIYGRTETGEEDKTVINSYAGRNAGDMVIPEGVEKIESEAFYEVGLTNIEIPEGVTTIGMASFSGENLKKLVIPSTMKNISFLGFKFSQIECIEFKGNTFTNQSYAISTDNIEKIIVPYSEDHSVLAYYKGLIENGTIRGNVGSVIEQGT